jgi:CRP/FNR family transcriptional regulator, cyclic AMP receptor protein
MLPADLIQSEASEKSFAAGDVIFAEGEPGDELYVVKEGEIRISIQGRNVETVGPGGMAGEMALIDAKARSATVLAKTKCTLYAIDRDAFLRLVGQAPDFSLEVMRVLAHRLRWMDAHL